ncbi:MAG: tetratricopeptide repeat protein [Chryseobacterium sp.]|uniref:tetratricopeptide repeat protein n=1 Tax=Chryseobacterium sp. TaxID=1871047 RepID=UPI0025C2D727|nr:tetratricopeptide repeat protein [Chryseobacterium sp.]MCJ7934538.1 tetratricopeptide repeat protein [Chryseobacterium sp.]
MKLSIFITLVFLYFYSDNVLTSMPDCKIQVQEKNIVLLCHDKKIVYKDLVINEMSVSTDFIKGKNNEFSLLYELNASTTKIKEKYNFIYSDHGIFLIYKEVLKFGKDGIMSNRIYFDAFDMRDRNYESLESLGDQLEETFAHNNAAVSYFDLKNKKFATRIFKASNEDIFINYPEPAQRNIIITDVEAANNLAFSLEQKGAYSDAKLLLNNIISQYPERVVAYLNLADAEWSLDNKEEAKKNYNLYLSLMKKQNKNLSKIPKRVYDRIN